MMRQDLLQDFMWLWGASFIVAIVHYIGAFFMWWQFWSLTLILTIILYTISGVTMFVILSTPKAYFES